jgi:hypothetical protein
MMDKSIPSARVREVSRRYSAAGLMRSGGLSKTRDPTRCAPSSLPSLHHPRVWISRHQMHQIERIDRRNLEPIPSYLQRMADMLSPLLTASMICSTSPCKRLRRARMIISACR